MIRREDVAKALAFVVALGLHVGLASVLLQGEPIEMEGASGGAEVRLGSSFQDLVEGGVTSARTPERPMQPETPTETPNQPVQAVTHTRSATPVTQTLTPQTLPDILPTTSAMAVVEPTVGPPDPPIRPNVPVEVEQAEASQEAQRLNGSPRPTARPQRVPQPERPTSSRQAAAGSAAQNANAGASSGTQEGRSVSRGTAGRQAAAGNAAADNYPGEVMRCISRAGRPRVTARGAATVAFAVAPNGEIISPRLSTSSGNSRLDRAALTTIQNAGPCPEPPPNAQTSFTIKVRGR